MNKRVKNILNYVFQCLLGGCIVFGIWNSVMAIHLLEIGNEYTTEIYVNVNSVLFGLYFYKSVDIKEKHILGLIWRIIRYGVGCLIVSSLLVILAMGRPVRISDLIELNYGSNVVILLSCACALSQAIKNDYFFENKPIAEIGAGKAVQELDPTLLEMLEK